MDECMVLDNEVLYDICFRILKLIMLLCECLWGVEWCVSVCGWGVREGWLRVWW